MKIGRLFWVGAVLHLGVMCWAGTNAPLENATSASRQFIAYAPDPVAPATICIFAERIKDAWLNQLAIADEWHDPIVIVFRPGLTNDAPAISLGVFQIGPMVKYEISSRIPPAPDETLLAAKIVEALCLETANRNRTTTPWKSAQIPFWLVQGLTGVVQGDSDWLLTVARRSATAARPPAVSDLMRVIELPADEVARDLFLANSWLLTDGLLRLPDGGQRLHRLLTELRTSEDAFAKVYPEFAGAVALEKWWSLLQAQLTTIITAQNLTTHETSQQLNALLTMPDGQPFNNLYRQSDKLWLRQAVARRVMELEQLYSRAHPLYRPALEAYIEAGRWFVEEKISRYRRSVARADQLHRDVRREAEAISVTMDWAEQKYTTGASSNIWSGYFQALDQLKNLRHRDPISNYLDQFDK